MLLLPKENDTSSITLKIEGVHSILSEPRPSAAAAAAPARRLHALNPKPKQFVCLGLFGFALPFPGTGARPDLLRSLHGCGQSIESRAKLSQVRLPASAVQRPP